MHAIAKVHFVGHLSEASRVRSSGIYVLTWYCIFGLYKYIIKQYALNIIVAIG